uniref:Thioesterase domain-containing protein n=1 Tax=Heliothis virescens TaxID=7102 RepID=A0A2A4JN21_HELVI
MAASGRASRLLKAMDRLASKTTFDHGTVLSKLKLQSSANGTFQGTFTVDQTMCNMGGSLHGGYIASVIDVLSFYTQLSNTDSRLSWTTSMNVNYVGAAFDGENVKVETKTLKVGSTSIVETYFHNEKGNLLAKGTTSFLSGPDKYQKLIKVLLDFDVNEN